MKKQTLLILLTCLALANAMAQTHSFLKKKITKTLTNEKIALSQIIDNQAFVLVFYDSDCPICQKYVPILRGVADSFPEVKFVVVFTKWDSLQAVTNFARTITSESRSSSVNNTKHFAYIWDYKNKLIKKVKALTTPEAFLFNNKGELQYRGAIDNWFYALGKYRPQATEDYLKNALTQFSKNEKIIVSETTPIGCYIEY